MSKELSAGNYSLLKFYERRIRRIFPALFTIVISSTIIAILVMTPEDLVEFSQSVIATLAFVANIFFWLKIDYFASYAETKPLLHMWSLAVEEQFYLFFPLLMAALWKQQRLFRVVLILGSAFSLAASIYGVRNNPDPTFYFMPTRAWELCLGSFLALGTIPRLNPAYGNIASLAGFLFIISSILLYRPTTPFPGEAALLPCIGAALVIWAGQGNNSTWVTKLLSTRPAVFIGKISYSLYLWHWPIIVFYLYVNPAGVSQPERLLLLVLTFLLSVLTWKYVEQPFRSSSYTIRPKYTVLSGFGAVGMLIILIYPIALFGGMPNRFSEWQLHILAEARASIDENNLVMKERNSRFKKPGEDLHNSKLPSVLLWGDSHATSLVPALTTLAQRFDNKVLEIETMRSCQPLLNADGFEKNASCKAFNQAVARYIEHSSVETVVIAGRWSGMPLKANDPAKAAIFEKSLSSSILTAKASGKKVFLVVPVPEASFDVPRYTVFYAKGTADEKLSMADDDAKYSAIEAVLIKIATDTGAHIILPRTELCTAGQCVLAKDLEAMYFDHHHLSRYAARSLSHIFEKVFVESNLSTLRQ